MTDDDLLRYSRHLLLEEIGIEGQQRLLDASALVIGAGGLGSPVALYLGSAVTWENAPVPTLFADGTVAVTLNTDVDGDGDRDNVGVTQVSAELGFRYRGLGVEAELYQRWEDWGAIPDGQTTPLTIDDDHLGWFAQASYFVLPERFQLGARLSWADVSPLTPAFTTR